MAHLVHHARDNDASVLEQLLRARWKVRAAKGANLLDAKGPQVFDALRVVRVLARQLDDTPAFGQLFKADCALAHGAIRAAFGALRFLRVRYAAIRLGHAVLAVPAIRSRFLASVVREVALR